MADVLQCFCCKQLVEGYVDGLRRHLNIHFMKKEFEKNLVHYTCMKRGCRTSSRTCGNLKHHITTKHPLSLFSTQNNVMLDPVSSHKLTDDTLQSTENYKTLPKNSDNHSNNQEKLTCNLESIREFAAVCICQLKADVSFTDQKIKQAMNFGESLVGQINEYVRQKMSAFLEKFVSHIPPEKSVALQNSIWLDNIFKHVETSSKQETFINSLIGAIPKPRSIMLNGKEVKRFVDGKEKCKKVILNQFLISSLHLTEPKIVLQAYDTFQYIPIVESLKMILKNPDNRLALTEKEPFNERSGVYQSFIDGKQYKNSDYFKAYPNALRIIIYDDVEPCNALSSRAGNNKISAMYFKIQNLPQRFNASTKSVFPLIYAKSIDTKKQGYNKILLPLVEDLKKLEKGVTIYINNQNITIRGAVIVVAGDTLAIHELFGLLGPSARLFCRECTITRNNFLNDPFDSQYHLRDRAWYEDNLEQVQKKNISSKDCGLKTTGCILNDLQHFHLTNNHCLDVMHDLAEGQSICN